jgi:hypothetical protein
MRWVGMRGHAIGLIIVLFAGQAHAQGVARASIKGPEAIALVIQDAAADPPKATAVGESIEIAVLESNALWPDLMADLDKVLADAGMTVISVAPSGAGAVRTVELESGARATLYVDHNSGWITLTPTPAAVKPRGRCVEIPAVRIVISRNSQAVDHHGQFHSNNLDASVETARLHDIDGDAVMDAFVPTAPADACPEQASWKVYVVRGSCGHYVGEVGPGYVEKGPDRHRGYADLETSTSSSARDLKDPAPIVTRSRRQYEMRRGRYRQRSATTTSSGRCHHCGLSSCSRASGSPD